MDCGYVVKFTYCSEAVVVPLVQSWSFVELCNAVRSRLKILNSSSFMLRYSIPPDSVSCLLENDVDMKMMFRSLTLQALSRQFLLCVSPIQSSRLLHLLKPKDCWVSISHTLTPSQPSSPRRPTKASQTPRTSPLLLSSARIRRLQSVLHNPQKFKN